VIDAVRFAKLALDNGISGALEFPSAYLMKSPPVQHPDEFAREQVEEFIRVNARPGAPAPVEPTPVTNEIR
jgi:myo-inositol-1-phosphate synthase